MDKTPILLLILIPALALAGKAEDEATKEYNAEDKNKDGNLSVEEMSLALMEADAIRGNKDGKVDLQEYIAEFKCYFKNAEDEIPTNLFNAYDVNCDTFVDNKDFIGLHDLMDAEKDCILTLAEYLSFIVPYIQPMFPEDC